MNHPFKTTTTQAGARAEDRALAWLEAHAMTLVVRNYRCKGGEIDLIMRANDETLVFIEVRERRGRAFGGAAASVTTAKQRRLLVAAAQYLLTLDRTPPCRFDVVAMDGGRLEWLQNAFDLDAAAS
ncbi:YraN family protein [Cupriavidus plantarum]|uniref:UPF0102 protein C7419_10868 n=1 Tax=Cupriavidus plantarum TaxID=942865 RepID=A0A316EJH8_9BURK|nr:YraN family protein [Cupriavidus plantarum]NYH97284.1 putative endonuclease [Cupriavidus plantarum]PWK31927.1 putative endonuclease [Cupriavidus plantarum]REE86329.1 putative endonuclease [Cupriavidus plantarum]RLK29155.1 putative endonuclease [Cupriavidus plantarum]CAG2149722.1 hypothetical protein LMG26296_04570 [Cupriavidus plantarum]